MSQLLDFYEVADVSNIKRISSICWPYKRMLVAEIGSRYFLEKYAKKMVAYMQTQGVPLQFPVVELTIC